MVIFIKYYNTDKHVTTFTIGVNYVVNCGCRGRYRGAVRYFQGRRYGTCWSGAVGCRGRYSPVTGEKPVAGCGSERFVAPLFHFNAN
jgi:hypothetical protein